MVWSSLLWNIYGGMRQTVLPFRISTWLAVVQKGLVGTGLSTGRTAAIVRKQMIVCNGGRGCKDGQNFCERHRGAEETKVLMRMPEMQPGLSKVLPWAIGWVFVALLWGKEHQSKSSLGGRRKLLGWAHWDARLKIWRISTIWINFSVGYFYLQTNHYQVSIVWC